MAALEQSRLGQTSAKVAIVILNWNGCEDTSRCLASLRRLQYPSFEVIVVDNDSSDGSPSRIRAAFPEVTVVEPGSNLGFAGGCNVGIHHGIQEGAEFLWLLNNDTTVDPGALQALVDKASDPEIGAVGSAIYYMEDPSKLQAWGGGHINFWLGRSRHFEHAVPDKSIDFITGASMLIRREAVDKVGVLDERFFMYWEDADYCYRLRASGWKLAVAGNSRIWHKGSSTVGRASARLDQYFNASAVRFFQRHARLPAIPLWTGVTLRLGKRLLSRDWERARAVWAAANHI